MAKSTHSQEVLTGTSDSYTEYELSDVDGPSVIERAHVQITRAELGRVDQSAGTDSSQSSKNEQQTNKGQNPQEPAQTTESLSDQSLINQENSIVPTTDGPTRTMDQGSPEIPPYAEWSKEELQEECRQRGLPVSGNKTELINRLDENDAEFEDE